MLTIAGGILLAILILILLSVLGELIAAIVGVVIAIVLIVLAIDNIEISLVVCAIFFIGWKYLKTKESKNEEAKNLFKQLGTKNKLSRIYEKKGELLLNSKNAIKKGVSYNITLENFEINLSYYYSDNQYYMSFKKIGAQFKRLEVFDDSWDWLPKKMSVDEIFLLDKDLDSFINTQMEKQIEIGKSNESSSTGFFEDAKRCGKGDSKVLIFQHILTQDGIEAIRPIMCNGQILADVKIDFNSVAVNLYIEAEKIATVNATKWNELRLKGKIKFMTEGMRRND